MAIIVNTGLVPGSGNKRNNISLKTISNLCRCSTGADLSVTKHFSRVGNNVYIVGKGR